MVARGRCAFGDKANRKLIARSGKKLSNSITKYEKPNAEIGNRKPKEKLFEQTFRLK